MSDYSSLSPNPVDPMDPKRPWITDPREDPAGMNWMQSFTNPFGETSRLHFTRGWTMLFFIRLIWYVGFAVLAMIFAAAGADNASNYVPPSWVFLIVIALTALASLVMHIRRLSDAKRSALLAILVVIPVMSMLGGLAIGSIGGAMQYQQAVERMEREASGETPEAEVAEVAAPGEEGETASGEVDAESTGDGDAADGEQASREGRRGGQGGRGEWGPQLDPTTISEREHALQSGIGLAMLAWAVPSFFVMLWSLLWVGRLPTGGGSIRSRFEA